MLSDPPTAAPALFTENSQRDVSGTAQCRQGGVIGCRAVTLDIKALQVLLSRDGLSVAGCPAGRPAGGPRLLPAALPAGPPAHPAVPAQPGGHSELQLQPGGRRGGDLHRQAQQRRRVWKVTTRFGIIF